MGNVREASGARHPLAGRRCIVTGAASGIGRETARQLAALGARVALWDRDADAVGTAADELDMPHAAVDISDADAVAAAFETSVGDLDGLDGVVNSAGIQHAGLFADVPVEQHIRTITVNLVGSIVVAHAAVPHLRRTRGSLVLIGSISGAYGPPEFSSYAASKAGVINLSESISLELEPQGIHVALVTPLFVDTPMTRENPDPQLVRSIGAVHTTAEVAAAIIDGMVHRRRTIYPSWRPRAIWALTRQASFLGPSIMRMNWRNGSIAKLLWSRR